MFLINLYSIYLNLLLDAPKSLQFGFQDPASPMAEGLIDLHNYIFIFLIIVCSFVLWMLYTIVSEFGAHRYNANLLANGVVNSRWYEYIKTNHLTHGVLLEIIWTLIPTFILLFMAMPSFALLYAMDEVIDPELTLKIMGHQWYWSYEFSDFNDVLIEDDYTFDSYMIPEEELDLGSLRLLETDCRVVLPANTHMSLVITAGDVLHCWAVPSLGVKMDAVPGSLNQSSIFMKSEGLFFGQCSELCGVNHGFMPIVVNAVPLDHFLAWVISNNNK